LQAEGQSVDAAQFLALADSVRQELKAVQASDATLTHTEALAVAIGRAASIVRGEVVVPLDSKP
jgi:hypothetical protein